MYYKFIVKYLKYNYSYLTEIIEEKPTALGENCHCIISLIRYMNGKGKDIRLVKTDYKCSIQKWLGVKNPILKPHFRNSSKDSFKGKDFDDMMKGQFFKGNLDTSFDNSFKITEIFKSASDIDFYRKCKE